MDHLIHPKYRQDIDGLRAFAVLLVVSFHIFPNNIQGGFIGVDIFFVISGYLISTIMFNNLENNQFSFSEFYLRRIRRIFPALVVVLFTTLIAGWFILLPPQFMLLGLHTVAGSTFLSNIQLIREGGYFDLSGQQKPLLHLWSLGVEEQFYIVYPLILWLTWRYRFNLFKVTLLIALISFGFNLYFLKVNLAIDFYSPITRFWELMIGSMLAYLTLHESSIKAQYIFLSKYIIYRPFISNNKSTVIINNIISISGVFLLSISFILTKENQFPGLWAVLPTFGTAFLIKAGSKAYFNKYILSNKYIVYIGLISYPLYLWHWPILFFIQNSSIVVVISSFLLSALTYQFIEKPLRFGNYKKFNTIFLMSSMLIIGLLGFSITFNHGIPDRLPVPIRSVMKPIGLEDWFENVRKNKCHLHNATFTTHDASCYENQRPSIALWGGLARSFTLPRIEETFRTK